MKKNYIENPISHPEWDPSKGDYYNDTVLMENKLHQKSIKRKKLFLHSLIIMHIVLLVLVFFFVN